jgi:hypothetical protein
VKKRVALYFIIFQIIIIASIGIATIRKTNTPKISVNPLNAEYLTFHPVDGLKYFYELKPNIVWGEASKYLKLLGSPDSKVIYTLNKDGLNQHNNYSEEKNKSVYRIVAMGDSLTFGANVNTQDNYPQQLENLLKKECRNSKFEVLNLGVPGYDIKYAVERYKLRGMKYDPSLVLWLFIDGDFKRIDEKQIIATTLLHKDIEKLQGPAAAMEDNTAHVSWLEAMDKIIAEAGGEDNVLKLQAKGLNELNSYFRRDLVTFTFFNTPKKYKKILSDFSKSRQGITFFDGIPDVERLNDGHPTTKGYTTIVQNLFDYLTKNKIVPCKS